MRFSILLLFCLYIITPSCKKEPEPDPTPYYFDSLPYLNGNGCYIKTIINDQLKPRFTYYYLESNPTLIDYYYEHDPITGNVMNTYRYKYSPNILGGVKIDTVFHYLGDIWQYPAGSFYTATVFYYSLHELDEPERMDSALVYVFSTDELYPFEFKGTRYFGYRDDGLLEYETYFDDINYSTGSFYDNYTIEYTYYPNKQLKRFDYYNYNNELTYFEEYELSDFLQPNIKVVEVPALVKAKLYAPKKTTVKAFGGAGTYTYNYTYQTNQYNYIVEQSMINSSGDTSLLYLFTYDCIYD